MAAWVPVAGETLMMPSGAVGLHMFVILNDPIAINGYGGAVCVLVCACSVPQNNLPYDKTCLLAPHSHPFITHDSYIAYRHTRIDQAAHLVQSVTSGVFIPRGRCADPPFSAIKAGLDQSLFTKRAFKNLPI